MKPADRKLFKGLQEAVINLHMYWMVYRQLFDSSEKRIRLLNATGSHVFYVFQNLLIDEITLSISRLTDPAFSKVKGHRVSNLSIDRLLVKVDGRSDPVLKTDLKRLLNISKADAKKFRERRNKAVAHHDLASVLKIRTSIPGISKRDIKSAISAIAKTMNVFEYYHLKSTTAYDMTILPLGSDGNYLIEILKRGQWFRELERDRRKLKELWEGGEFGDA